MIKGAIFDLDGTILDSMGMWSDFSEEYLISKGIEPKPNLRQEVKNLTIHNTGSYFKKEYGIIGADSEIMKRIEDYYKYNVLLKTGAESFLKELYENKVRMVIATLTDKSFAELALNRLGIRQYFLEILDCRDIDTGKEKPDIYRKALACLGTKKSETAVFEDAFYALHTAKKDGFIAVGVFDKHEKDQKKIKEICNYYIKDFKEERLK